ncbi:MULTISPECIES: TorD/DmsD family molecular chaperone [Roseovarius]|uniref:TorD/DmsD family molecular chaperone n=1 Tax=Roseovarius TaxID=74030 RepID=UPI000CDD0CCD|nr:MULTISPECIES: molecular chaperone TorD family protein [Roseovarius]
MSKQETVMTTEARAQIAEEDRLRADLYDFLGVLLAAPPSEALLAQTASLSGDNETDLGVAVAALSRIAKHTKPQAVEREFNALFIGLGRGELLPYASYYLTGFLNEKPLASLRRDMAARGMTRAQNVYEPEDNIASLMEMMGGLITGRFGKPANLSDQKTFFNTHIGPWAGHFFTDLEAAKNSVLYASVGAVGRVFMEIEAEGFRMSAEGSA